MSMSQKTRIVILGGGFGGVTTARRLERLCKRRPDVVKISLDSEAALPLRKAACDELIGADHKHPMLH